ncbi:MAG: hypothetical protein ACXWA3_16835 [Acidimicrobiales bacterium]
MKRRTLDIVFSAGAVLLAGLLLVLGLVLQNQADFAKSYVKDQLTQQKITFTPVDKLTDEEKQATCIVSYASQPLTTGKQAECYANHYIAVHLGETNDGKTYSETSTESRAAQTAADAATKANSADAADLTAQAKVLAGKTDTLFRGETLRGLLLTSYGFSIFGERAQQAAYLAYAAALVLFLASIAGFIHAFTTPKDERILTAAQHAEEPAVPVG